MELGFAEKRAMLDFFTLDILCNEVKKGKGRFGWTSEVKGRALFRISDVISSHVARGTLYEYIWKYGGVELKKGEEGWLEFVDKSLLKEGFSEVNNRFLLEAKYGKDFDTRMNLLECIDKVESFSLRRDRLYGKSGLLEAIALAIDYTNVLDKDVILCMKSGRYLYYVKTS